MTRERQNYYQYQKQHKDKPHESKSRYDHEGDTIKISTIMELEALAHDYVCMKRSCTYFEAFDMVLKMIDVMRKQSRAIDKIQKNYTI